MRESRPDRAPIKSAGPRGFGSHKSQAEDCYRARGPSMADAFAPRRITEYSWHGPRALAAALGRSDARVLSMGFTARGTGEERGRLRNRGEVAFNASMRGCTNSFGLDEVGD